jgi:HAL2 family 3'(2'),5'-bisphosphate nucleotidase
MILLSTNSFRRRRFGFLAVSFSICGRSRAAFLSSQFWSTVDRALYSTSSPDYLELPSDFPRRHDAIVALEAVRKACAVTLALQPDFKDGISSLAKTDLSPVTVADFAAQAIVLRHLHETFPNDSFIAEESSHPLGGDEQLAHEVMTATSMEDVDIVCKSIDLGKEFELWKERGGRPSRVWCLDPVDGTKGFLRGKRDGGQYCVALALLQDGSPTIGVLGCPNLPVSPSDFHYAWRDNETSENNQDSRGCIFVASKGGGCYQLPFVPVQGECGKTLSVTPNDGSSMKPEEGRFCLGVESFGDALGQVVGTAKVLHGEGSLTEDGEIVRATRIDSQTKYGVIARGGAEYYARLTKPGYLEWIWDHAAGNVVITEAGGQMTDTEGDEIDFSLGAKMSEKVLGVFGSNGGAFHEALLSAFQKQEEERLEKLH